MIQRQAAALDIPLIAPATSRDDYEESFTLALCEFKRGGIEVGGFGDIDIDSHRKWAERVCSLVDIEPFVPGLLTPDGAKGLWPSLTGTSAS